MLNQSVNNGGIYRAFIIDADAEIRIYIPGLFNDIGECPINSDGSLNMEIYQKSKHAYPIPLWCLPNIEAKQHEQVHPCWVVFENGDVSRPIVMGFLGKGIMYHATSTVGTNSPYVSGGGSGGSTDGNALKIYQFYDALGVPKVNISGILGNYTVENGIDPTTVEGIYDEPFNMGPKKQDAQSNWDSYTRDKLFAAYAGSVAINKSAYKAKDGKYYPGIAINSATGEGARELLEYANKMNMSWFSLDLQLMFNLQFTGTKGVSQYKFMTQNWNTPEASPSAAAITYGQKYEHGGLSPTASGILNTGERESSAASWFSKMNNWESDLNYGYALIKKAGYNAPTQASNFDKNIWDSADYKNLSSGSYVYPLSQKHTLDPFSGGRAFGASRNNGARAHAGIDLIVPPKVNVIAMIDGTVEYISYNFYGGTDAVITKNSDGTWFTYGEMRPSVSVGQSITKGQVIGTIIANNVGGSSMLHFEAYKGDYSSNVLVNNGSYKYVTEKNYKRRADLVDPSFVVDLPMYSG